MGTKWRPLIWTTLVIAAVSCTVNEQPQPGLTGPSEFGLSLALTATPDVLVRDGTSQATIQVVARDPAGQPVPNQTVRLDILVRGVVNNDFGRLSSHFPTTAADGRAVTTYTAPPPAIDQNDPDRLTIQVTPVGSNADAAVNRTVSIRLVPPGKILVPGSPVAEFTYRPASPVAGADVLFDASLSYDPDGTIVSYEWDYGDGDKETGVTQLHDFPNPGKYNVTLTVTDNSGLRASRTRTIEVKPSS